MTTFPQTATLGHAAVYPARPIPKLHELTDRPVRRPASGGTIKARVILCTNEEHHWVSEALAKRRMGAATKRKALPRHKAK